MSQPIDDDTFEYGGKRHSIAGTEREGLDVLEGCEPSDDAGYAMSIVQVFACWCRHHNGERQRLEQQLAAVSEERDQLREAAQALFDADHYDHFAARMSDTEMAAIEQLLAALQTKEQGT